MAKIKKTATSSESTSLKFKNKNALKKKSVVLKPKFDIGKLKEALKPENNGIDPIKETSSEKLFTDYKEIFSPLWSKYKARNSVHISSNQEWTLQLIVEPCISSKIDSATIKRLRILAKQIFDDDVKLFLQSQEQKGSQNRHFQKTVLSHGTSKDKAAAYALRCLETPVYCIRDLLTLINLVDVKSKLYKIEAVENLKTLFKKTYLPNGFVAKRFENHNFKVLLPLINESPEHVEKQFALWHFEDQVRYAYLQLIRKLEETCKEVHQNTKINAVKLLTNLLFAHPKQDVEICMSILVSRLGDTIGGEVSYKINSLLNKYSHMKMTTVCAVKDLIDRPNVTKKARHMGLCCLSNFLFNPDEQKLIEEIISIYIKFFVTISKKGEVDSRFMSVLLQGLNRALPYYSAKKITFLEEKMNSLYTMCHLVNFNIGTQTLQLLFNITTINDSQFSDRFYNVLYEKLLNSEFGNSSSVTQFLNLVYRVLAEDKKVSRVRAFARRLIQVSHYLPPNVICGILFLLSEVVKDNENIHSLNSLLRRKSIQRNILDDLKDDDDDMECYTDLDTDGEDEEDSDDDTEDEDISSSSNKEMSPTKSETNLKSPAASSSSWLHRDNFKSEIKDETMRTNKYLPQHRNPMFCGADLSHAWEITSLTKHYHPSVVKFASDLIEKNIVHYSGDPLLDFTLKRFLDRFALKNPKKIAENDKQGSFFGKRSKAPLEGVKKLSIDSEEFKRLKEENVPVDDLFCYKYMTQFNRPSKRKRSKEDDTSSVDDEDFDEYLDRSKQLTFFGGGGGDDNDVESDEGEDVDFAKGVDDVGFAKGTNAVDFSKGANDVDFAKGTKNGPRDQRLADDNQSSDEDDEDDDMEDYEGILAQDRDDDGSDFEDVDFSEDDYEEESQNSSLDSKKKKSKKSSTTTNWQNLLADAEEFSAILESTSGIDDPLTGTSEQLKPMKLISGKQLKWEKTKYGNPTHSRMGSKPKSGKSKRSSFGKGKKFKK